jgi:hypothetical protein
MKRLLYPIVLLAGLALVPLSTLMAQTKDAQRPLVLSDAVLPTSSKDALLDARIFNPEFYRKFNPDLGLATDAEATKQWTSSGANHCLRASFSFYSTDYLNRYPEQFHNLSPMVLTRAGLVHLTAIRSFSISTTTLTPPTIPTSTNFTATAHGIRSMYKSAGYSTVSRSAERLRLSSVSKTIRRVTQTSQDSVRSGHCFNTSPGGRLSDGWERFLGPIRRNGTRS